MTHATPLVRQFVADVIETGKDVLRNGATSPCCAGVGWLRCCGLSSIDLLRHRRRSALKSKGRLFVGNEASNEGLS